MSIWRTATSDSFELASRLVVLAATNVAALAVTLYVSLRYPHQKYQCANIAALSGAHLLSITQTTLLVVAYSHGWASEGASNSTEQAAMAAICVLLVAGLRMRPLYKLYSISVFGAGLLANIPLIFALVYLYRQRAQIVADPTRSSTHFLYANQASITVSLWCRALEAARGLQRDVGHATWGHTGTTANGSQAASGYLPKAAGDVSARLRQLSRRRKRLRTEDEVELQAMQRTYQTSIGARDGDLDYLSDGIEVTRQISVE